MPDQYTPEQVASAFKIADECMFSLLEVEGFSGDEHGTTICFVDDSCQEVRSLAEASAAMCEAFEWLQSRGCVELGTDGEGEFVQVVRRPGED